MKKIVKQNPPDVFLSWRDMGGSDWTPAWVDLAGEKQLKVTWNFWIL